MKPLNVIVISNLYPPHSIGGYEIGCREVVTRLRARGHQMRVLTSSYGVDGSETGEVGVMRCLSHDIGKPRAPDLLRRAWRLWRKERANRNLLRRVWREQPADLIFGWNLGGIGFGLVEAAARLAPTRFYISDSWLSDWARAVAKSKGLMTRLLPRPDYSDWGGSLFCSAFLKNQAGEAGLNIHASRVVPWAVDVHRFAFRAAPRPARRILFAGQVTPHKGTRTAIEAISLLAKQGRDSVTLTVVGGWRDAAYLAELRAFVADAGLQERVHFVGVVPHDALAALYREHDVLIFPSIWDEPFSIVLLEALASGLAVVGTTTGGSSEILRDGDNALTFPAGDAASCALQVARLLDDAALCERLRHHARQTIEHDFDLEIMVERIEAALFEAVAASADTSSV